MKLCTIKPNEKTVHNLGNLMKAWSDLIRRRATQRDLHHFVWSEEEPATRFQLLPQLLQLLVPHVLEWEHVHRWVSLSGIFHCVHYCLFVVPSLLLCLWKCNCVFVMSTKPSTLVLRGEFYCVRVSVWEQPQRQRQRQRQRNTNLVYFSSTSAFWDSSARPLPLFLLHSLTAEGFGI